MKMGKADLNRDPHNQLFDAIEANDLESFKQILDAGLENSSIDLKHTFYIPYGCTILDICCIKPDKLEFTKKLLSVGVDVNFSNIYHAKCPIHIASMKGYTEVLQALIKHPQTDVGLLDEDNNSALYHAVKHGHVECCKLLLEYECINPNRKNRRGTNAVYEAATLDEKNDEIMLALIRCPRVNLDKIIDEDEPLRETIIKNYPHLENEILMELPRNIIDEDDDDLVFSYLQENNIQGFISYITSHPDKIESSEGKYNILQYACHFGLPEVVEVLLNLGADPNSTSSNKSSPDSLPIFLASYRGFADIIQLFLNSDKNIYYQTKKTNVLIEVTRGLNNDHGALYVHDDLCDHDRSIKLLLTVDSQYDINFKDFFGNTCLHYAVKSDNRECIFSLLDHGAYLGIKNNYGYPPLDELTYDTFELYLNKCILSNELSSNNTNYTIMCSYKFLCPPKIYTQYNDNQIQSETQNIIIKNIPETYPLLHISNVSKLRPLLTHPALTTFIDLKWHKLKIHFIMNLAYFTVFVGLLTMYILLTSKPLNDAADTPDNYNKLIHYCRYMTLGFLIVLCIRELFQFISFPITYIKSIENWLEICLISFIFVLLYDNDNKKSYRKTLSVIVLLMSWSEMILLWGRHPSFAVQLEMYKRISKNFIYFLSWYSIIVISFFLSFYVLFSGDNNSNSFKSWPSAIFKTLSMVIVAEYDSTSYSFNASSIVGHLLFILFILIITLVLMNLLSGLAVNDTHEIKTDAKIVALVSRIKYIHSAETMAINETNFNLFKKRLGFNFLSTFTEQCLRELKLFPKALKNPYIKILPNQGYFIDFDSSEDKNILWFFANFLGNYSDIETAEKIKVIMKLNSEEPEQSVDTLLNEFVERLNSIEREVNGIKESMKNAKTLM